MDARRPRTDLLAIAASEAELDLDLCTSILLGAAGRGDAELVRSLLGSGLSPDACATRGCRALHLAAYYGHATVVSILLDAGAVADAPSDDATPLFYACAQGHAEVARILLRAGAWPGRRDRTNRSPMLVAARRGHVGAIAALLEAGAPDDFFQDGLQTPLSAASTWGFAEAVDLLVRGGASVEARRYHANGCPSPLQLACLHAHANVVSVLLRAGADVDGWETDAPLAPPLGIACMKGSLEVVQMLCMYGALRSHRYEHFAAGMPNCGPITEWLQSTRRWCSRLHYFALMDAAQVRDLLRAGANPHLQSTPATGDPSPVSLARAHLGDEPPDESPAGLIVAAAGPWSPSTDALHPLETRTRARELLRIGHLLAARLAGEQVAWTDAWLAHVMPFALSRAGALPANQ